MSTNITSKKVYYMFNKPTGCITARSDECHKTVMDYLTVLTDTHPGLHPVGRLDKDTEGLLLITNDGHFNQRLMLPDRHVAKTYEFLAMGDLTKEEIAELETGIYFTGDTKKTAPCTLTIHWRSTIGNILSEDTSLPFHITEKTWKQLKKNRTSHPIMMGSITITEGRKHHIKRLIKHAGGCVIALKRVAIGELMLDEKLQPGAYRELTEEELQLLL